MAIIAQTVYNAQVVLLLDAVSGRGYNIID